MNFKNKDANISEFCMIWKIYTKVCDNTAKKASLADPSLKSNNLQYNTLVHWFAGTNDSSTKCLMFQALLFFIISYRLGHLKFSILIFVKPYFFLNETIFAKNTRIIRHLVDELFVPATSVLCWRLMDF